MSRVLVLRHHLEDHPGLIGEALEQRGYGLDVAMMDESSPTPSLDGYHLLVILGSKSAAYDDDVVAAWFGRELALIAEAQARALPILGICFGAQALCVYHGGEVTPSTTPEIGWYEIEPVNDSPIPKGPWFEYHFDQCILPEGATLWARSDSAVQVFAIGVHVGVQFHPELDHLQLRDWFDADEDEARAFGVDIEALMARTENETPAARERAVELVDGFLRFVGLA